MLKSYSFEIVQENQWFQPSHFLNFQNMEGELTQNRRAFATVLFWANMHNTNFQKNLSHDIETMFSCMISEKYDFTWLI